MDFDYIFIGTDFVGLQCISEIIQINPELKIALVSSFKKNDFGIFAGDLYKFVVETVL
jgi:hypothetical protein